MVAFRSLLDPLSSLGNGQVSEEREDVAKLRASLHAIAETDVQETVARSPLGAMNFEEGRDLVERAKELASEWRSYPLDLGPPAPIQALYEKFSQLEVSIEGLRAFDIQDDNAKAQHGSLLSTLRSCFEAARQGAFNQRPNFVVLSRDFREPVRKARSLIENARTQVDEDLLSIKAMRDEGEEALRAIRESSKREGIQRFAPLFAALAAENDEQSRFWLKAAAVLGAVTAIAASLLLLLWPPSGQLSEASAAGQLISRLVIVSVLYLATFWAARNYRALRHLRVVNQHRHTALLTFQTFSEGGESPETRDAVLREATRCVFTPSTTGYLGADEETPATNIVEVLQSASRTGS